MYITGSLPFPYITKEGSLSSFKTVTANAFNSDFSYGSVITGSYYPLESTIVSEFYDYNLTIGGTQRKKYLLALKNTLNYYAYLSPHYLFSSSYGDKETQNLRLINIPSIYYGKSIRKRSVSCKWYYTGSLIAELNDLNGDGELIQVGPSGSNGSGSVAGVVLYNEGFVLLTGSWSLAEHTEQYIVSGALTNPAWIYFMTTGSRDPAEIKFASSSSFSMDFEGTETIPVMTMFAHAEKGEFNHSNNPTHIEYGQKTSPFTASNFLKEKEDITIKNIVTTNYDEEDPPFEKTTYISKVVIYDEEENIIGIAKLAKPVRKRENDNLTFKLKLDL